MHKQNVYKLLGIKLRFVDSWFIVLTLMYKIYLENKIRRLLYACFSMVILAGTHTFDRRILTQFINKVYVTLSIVQQQFKWNIITKKILVLLTGLREQM